MPGGDTERELSGPALRPIVFHRGVQPCEARFAAVDLAALVVDIERGGCRADHCGNRAVGAHLLIAGIPEPEGPLDSQSEARRSERTQPMVSAMAAVRHLLPLVRAVGLRRQSPA
jgi:hypothetical protein